MWAAASGFLLPNASPLPPEVNLSAGGGTASYMRYEFFNTVGEFDLADGHLQLTPGSALAPPFGFSAGPGTSCATQQVFGTGCGSLGSFHQSGNYLVGLAGRTLSLDLQGIAYEMTCAAGDAMATPQTPATSLVSTVQTVPLSEPMPIPGGSTQALTISTNGYIGVAGQAMGQVVPNVATLLPWTGRCSRRCAPTGSTRRRSWCRKRTGSSTSPGPTLWWPPAS